MDEACERLHYDDHTRSDENPPQDSNESPAGQWLSFEILRCRESLVVVVVQAFARFVHEGLGTPAPVAPTEHLVVGGLYRYVRNPMYLAVAATMSDRHSYWDSRL